MDRRCGDCTFFQPKGELPDDSERNWGECRSDPPRVQHTGYYPEGGGAQTMWPEVREDDWCGCFWNGKTEEVDE